MANDTVLALIAEGDGGVDGVEEGEGGVGEGGEVEVKEVSIGGVESNKEVGGKDEVGGLVHSACAMREKTLVMVSPLYDTSTAPKQQSIPI